MSQEKKNGRLKSWLLAKYEALRAWYLKDDNFLRRVRFPGTKLPLLDVLRDFVKLFTKGRTVDRAAGVAFNFFVALFPLILFFFTLVPYIPIPHLYERVMMLINDFLIPSGTLDFVTDTIDGIMNQPHEGLLSLSILLCLVFGSSGVVAFFNGFRNVYANYVTDKGLSLKSWIIQRIFAIVMLVVIGLLLVLSIMLISMGGMALKSLVTHNIISVGKFVFFLFNLLRWVIAIFALCFGISLLYYFGNVRYDEQYKKELKRPTRRGKKFREFVIFTPGTILATTLFVLGTVAFNTYISNFSKYNVLYGSIGTLIILMLWIWIVSILILAGNDLNSGIRRNAIKLSDSEANTRKKMIVVESLRKNIKTQEQGIDYRQHKISRLRKDVEEKQIVIHDLEEEIKDSELIIKAYKDFLEQELRLADQESLEDDSMRERLALSDSEA
ncbi:MAG: YihY/virulence factor BrkB family protein [Bacteroidales bacterium]|nr:YihY/virulence factor BrkB family protein [Bacteroidales bacterium]